MAQSSAARDLTPPARSAAPTRSIAVFNSKGGVGKSTATMFIADFFASRAKITSRPVRVLVVDLDRQNSAASALIGPEEVAERCASGHSFGHLLKSLTRRKAPDMDPFVVHRAEAKTRTRKVSLGALDVMVCDGDLLLTLESGSEAMVGRMVERFFEMADSVWDLVLFDMPASVDRRHWVVLSVLSRCSHVLVPTEVTPIAQRAIGQSLEIIRDVQNQRRAARQSVPEIMGILMNKTNRRTRAFRRGFKELERSAAEFGIELFDQHLPTGAALANAPASDESFASLRERYDNYYEYVRKVCVEIAERCGYRPKRAIKKPRAALRK